MHRPFPITAARLVALIISIALAASYVASARDTTPAPTNQTEAVTDLLQSEFAILRIADHRAYVAGVAFVVHQSPMQLLTCYHVVSEGTETNDGPVTYAIARRTTESNEIDARRVEATWLKVKHMLFKPEFDLAVLTIDPALDAIAADQLDLKHSKPLPISFDRQDRRIGSPVTWLTTAARGDLTLTPRLFVGNIVASYIADQTYSFESKGNATKQVMVGARMLEIDKLFIPGSSGSPILNAETKQVIGYVHAYRAFALGSDIDVTEDVEIGADAAFTKQKLKLKPPLITSVSLGIDMRTVEPYLTEAGYIEK